MLGSRPVASAQFEALGTTAVVAVTDLPAGRARSRGSPRARTGRPHVQPVSARFGAHAAASRAAAIRPRSARCSPTALSVPLSAAEATGGLVDPTVGGALVGDGVRPRLSQRWRTGRAPPRERRRPGGGRSDRHRPPGGARPPWLHLDLGATGKALAADRAATAAAAAADCGVLVSLGGDVRVAGPAPAEGWAIGIADDHRADRDETSQTVAIRDGAIATSSVRRALDASRHVVPPHHGPRREAAQPKSYGAPSPWPPNPASPRTRPAPRRSSSAPSAVGRLLPAGLAARLVARDGA